jgi:hypothetical protein
MSSLEWIYQVPLEWGHRPTVVPDPPHAVRGDLAALRASLSGTLAHKISTGAELQKLHERDRRTHLPTMLESFDRLLGGGLERGKVVELHGRRSTGRFAVVMAALAAATEIGEAAALIDTGDAFDPQLAAASRVDLERLLWVRPTTMKHAVMSAEMLIQTGFALVVIDLGLRFRGRRPLDATWVRLARAAEHHGASLLISTPWSVAGTAADSVISAHHSHVIWSGRGAAPKLLTEIRSTLTVEKQRGMKPGAHEELDVMPGEKPRRKRVRGVMLSRRSASARQRTSAEDGRSIPLCEATSFQQSDPSTSLQNASRSSLRSG